MKPTTKILYVLGAVVAALIINLVLPDTIADMVITGIWAVLVVTYWTLWLKVKHAKAPTHTLVSQLRCPVCGFEIEHGLSIVSDFSIPNIFNASNLVCPKCDNHFMIHFGSIAVKPDDVDRAFEYGVNDGKIVLRQRERHDG